jgi:hypothetical protein
MDVFFVLLTCLFFGMQVLNMLCCWVEDPNSEAFKLHVLNMLCCWVEDPNSEAFKLHLPRIQDYLWLAEDGMKMQVHKS